MKKYLEEYLKIMDEYIKDKINTRIFLKLFYALFNDNEFQKNASSKDFELINKLWEWVEAYEPNKEIRGSSYIDENQLKDKVKEFHKKIEDEIKNGRNNN